MSLFQSEAEQIQKIDAAAENAAREAESEKPSAFVISEDEIDRMLRTGSNFEGGKIRIYVLYQQQGDAKERAAFLKAEYGLGGHSYTFMDGSRGFADYDGKGILLRNYDHDREEMCIRDRARAFLPFRPVRTVTTIPYIIRTLRKLTVDRLTTRKSA